jgi:hypothetical protein
VNVTYSTPRPATTLVIPTPRCARPVDLLSLEVLDEVSYRDRNVEAVGHNHSQIARVLWTEHSSPQRVDAHEQDENGHYPDEPMSLQLVAPRLEFVVRGMPPEVKEATGELHREGCPQQLQRRPVIRTHHVGLNRRAPITSPNLAAERDLRS